MLISSRSYSASPEINVYRNRPTANDVSMFSASEIRSEPLLNIASYTRRGFGERGVRLTPEQIEHIRRTVRRDPEVMVKVLSRGAGAFKAV